MYSDVLTFLFGCNNNPVHLGASAAAKSAMFYLVKYITKDSTALNAALSILKDAKKHVDKWTSTALDAHSNPQRPSIHLGQRVVNSNGGMELADTQLAGVALGHKAHLSSEPFAYVSMDMLTHVGQALNTPTPGCATTTQSLAALRAAGVDCFGGAASAGEGDEEAEDEADPDAEVFGEEGAGEEGGAGEGGADALAASGAPRDDAAQEIDRRSQQRRRADPESAPEHGYVEFHALDGKPVPVPPALHYLHRGSTLGRFNLTELHACYALEAMDADEFEAMAAAEAGATGGNRKRKRPPGGEGGREGEEQRGRKEAARYLLHPEHPLHSGWRWRALHRLKVPKVGGPRPPNPPKQLGPGESVPSVWLEQQHQFAAFMVACFVPWFSGRADADEPFLRELEHSGPKPGPPPLTVDVLRAWIAHLQALAWGPAEDEGARVEAHIAMGRLRYLENFVHTLDAGQLQKMLSLQHKYRTADKWTVEEREAHKQEAAHNRAAKGVVEDLRAQLEGREVKAKDVAIAGKLELLANTAVQGLQALPPPAGSAAAGEAPIEGAAAGFYSHGRSKRDSNLSATAVANLAEISGAELRRLHAGPTAEASTRAATTSEEDMPPEFAEIEDSELSKLVKKWKKAVAACAEGEEPPLPPLNQGQRRFCRRLMPWLLDVRRARAAGEARAAWAPRLARKHGNLHLLHGAGGTGKTALLQVLEDVMLRGGFGRIVFLAYMGVAAALLPHGSTMCTGLGMKPEQLNSARAGTAPVASDTVTKFTALHGEPDDILLVVLDEVSFLSAPNIKHASSRIASILGLAELAESEEVPFGGLLTVMQGDFFQLPPVAARAIFVSVTHMLLGGMPGKTQLKPPALLGSERIGARIVVRARRFDLVQQMRAPNDARHAAWLQLLRRVDVTHPMPAELLEFLKGRVVTDRSDPAVAFAPSASTGHAETQVVGLHVLFEYALFHGLPVFRWALQLPEELYQFRGASVIAGLLEREPAALYDYFVKGAPAICLANHATAAGVANGTRGLYACVDLQPGTEVHVQAATAGRPTILTLSKTPHAVGIRLQTEREGGHSQQQHIDAIMAAGASMHPEHCVVPIAFKGGYKRKVHLSSTYAAEHGFPTSFSVCNNSLLPCNHDFSGTDYGRQGCTVRDFFLLFLGKRPTMPYMNLRSLYVLLSRVKHGSRILVMPFAGDLQHLVRMSHPVELRIFERAFTEEGHLEQRLMEQAAMEVDKVDTFTKSRVARSKRAAAAAHRRRTGAPVRQGPRPPPPPAAKIPPSHAAGSKAPREPAAAGPPRARPPRAPTRVDPFQSCKWKNNSCHMDTLLEVCVAICLALGVDASADGAPAGVLGGAIGLEVWRFVQLRMRIHRGELQGHQCRAVLRDLEQLRDAARQKLVETEDSRHVTMRTSGNVAENLHKAVTVPRWHVLAGACAAAAAGAGLAAAVAGPTRWLLGYTQRSCGCGAAPGLGGQGTRVGGAKGMNYMSPRWLQETDGRLFPAFARMLRAAWRPCAACDQAGALACGVFRDAEQWSRPGAAGVPDLLPVTLEAGDTPAVHVEASKLQTLRVGPAFVALLKPVAVVYYDGGHFICDVDLGTDAADPDVAAWYRYDHMNASYNGRGRPLPAPPDEDMFRWGGGPDSPLFRVHLVVYRRVQELATSPPCGLAFPSVSQHRFEVDDDLAAALRPTEATGASGGVPRGDVAAQNAEWKRAGAWHVGGSTYAIELAALGPPVAMPQGGAGAGGANGRGGAAAPASRICVVAAPAASLLRTAACLLMGADRKVALVSFRRSAAPAPEYGRGGPGPEEELCRVMPALHSQLIAAPSVLGSGDALVTTTLLCRESGTYAPRHPAVPVTVVSALVGGDQVVGGSAEWHAAVRIGAQAAFRAAEHAHVTDLVLSDDAFGSDPHLAAEGVATVCDVLRSHEFVGAFLTVVIGVCPEHKAVARAHLATFDGADLGVGSAAEPLAAKLDCWLRGTCGWTERSGVPVAVTGVTRFAAGVGLCDAARLAAAARCLHADGMLEISSDASSIQRGQRPGRPGPQTVVSNDLDAGDTCRPVRTGNGKDVVRHGSLRTARKR